MPVTPPSKVPDTKASAVVWSGSAESSWSSVIHSPKTGKVHATRDVTATVMENRIFETMLTAGPKPSAASTKNQVNQIETTPAAIAACWLSANISTSNAAMSAERSSTQAIRTPAEAPG